MSNLGYNAIVLAFCWLLVTGGGIWVTYFQQPEEIERLEKTERVARLRQAEVTSLLSDEYSSSQQAEQAIQKWRARYKIFPASLSSTDIVDYLNELTGSGYKNFDITQVGTQRTANFSYTTFRVTGRGFFSSLYKFVWKVENNRHFYRIRDLSLEHIDLVSQHPETGNSQMQVMVSFSLMIDAYFGGTNGLSANDSGDKLAVEENVLPTSRSRFELPPVPSSVLPKPDPSVNPFYPLILTVPPPNTFDFLDLDDATLISIVGNEAVFLSGQEYHTLGVGDDVYLGQIVDVDPTQDRVVARLNKGGIIDEVELQLQTGERYRQALGPVQLAPVQSN